MVLNIRNTEADNLARKLAQIEGTSITDALIIALRETIDARRRKESPTEAARKSWKSVACLSHPIVNRFRQEPITTSTMISVVVMNNVRRCMRHCVIDGRRRYG